MKKRAATGIYRLGMLAAHLEQGWKHTREARFTRQSALRCDHKRLSEIGQTISRSVMIFD